MFLILKKKEKEEGIFAMNSEIGRHAVNRILSKKNIEKHGVDCAISALKEIPNAIKYCDEIVNGNKCCKEKKLPDEECERPTEATK